MLTNGGALADTTVDIILATFNGERYIREQIESVQAQTYNDWRLLISDDCSSDSTVRIIRDFASKDARIHLVSENVRYGGAKENFYALMKLSDAPYVMFCDQDDVWKPEKISIELELIRKLEEEYGQNCPVMVHSDLELVDALGDSMRTRMSDTLAFSPVNASFGQAILNGIATGCTMAINRSLLIKALKCDSPEMMLMHDWWIVAVALLAGKRAYIDEPLVLYRQHGDNVFGAAVGSLNESYDKYRKILASSGLNAVRTYLVDDEINRIKQAASILAVYKSELRPADAHVLNEIINLPKSCLLKRIYIITRYGLWRRGAKRRLRQFINLCLIG